MQGSNHMQKPQKCLICDEMVMPKGCQAIIWTNDDLVYWHISLGIDEIQGFHHWVKTSFNGIKQIKIILIALIQYNE